MKVIHKKWLFYSISMNWYGSLKEEREKEAKKCNV